jgi:hypothetical protein
MAQPFSFMNFAVEDAMKAYFQSMAGAYAFPAYCQIYNTADVVGAGEELAEPYVAISAEDFAPALTEVDLTAGVSNQLLTLNIYVRTNSSDADANEQENGDTGRTQHKKIAGKVMDAISRTDLVAALNAVAGDVQFVQIDSPRGKTMASDRSYVTTITLQIHAYNREA